MRRHTPPLWAITSYFNPIGYSRRLTNYRTFRERLTVPLVTVELARSRDRFQLERGDADILIQLVGDDLLWQKERLLNIALQAVPAECTKIAWPDCDVVFEREDWGELTSAALEHFPLVQPFETFTDLSPEAMLHDGHEPAVLGGGTSVAYKLAAGETVEMIYRRHAGSRLVRGHALGIAWAARREVIERHGLYDCCILGSGDKAILLAALGRLDLVDALDMNERQTVHYLIWARRFFAEVGARIGYVEGRVHHLWHGDLKDRQHRNRLVNFKPFGFDPFVDLVRDSSGCWRWNNDNAKMRGYLRRYFEARHEDGDRRTAVIAPAG